VTEKAVDSINKAIKDQLGDVGGAILGPVVTKGMAALVGALGLDGGTSESEANPRYTEFITSLIAWVGSPGR
jgi:hypothetical protein